MTPRFLASGLMQLPRGDLLVVPHQLGAVVGVDFTGDTVQEVRATVEALLKELGYSVGVHVWIIDPGAN